MAELRPISEWNTINLPKFVVGKQTLESVHPGDVAYWISYNYIYKDTVNSVKDDGSLGFIKPMKGSVLPIGTTVKIDCPHK